ncbi:MAG: HAMP domain-containing histidine kinase [Bacteroidales bacterium]|nr:HAMP domain-containing histidine kinase [Bacteroidales bacterium]
MKSRVKYILAGLLLALALVALWQVQSVADRLRQNEEQKVRLWASAIGQRNQLATATQQFFQAATLDEQRKMRLYTDILQAMGDPGQDADLSFSLRYVNYIVDSARTPIIITTSRDSIISVPRELAGRKLEGALLREFSANPPFTYNVYGMQMTLYYRESEYYTHLRQVLEGITQSFLADIVQNSLLVPAVILDSSRTSVLAYGNIEPSQIERFDFGNDPVEVLLPSGVPCYVYYSSTPLLRSLRWVPVLYVFIALAIVAVAYLLLQTARKAEQNSIWVGLAKETAHQLGTPLSSLSGWVEYLRGKEFTPEYASEVGKDVDRLATIAQRFSKIGAVPELREADVRQATIDAVGYLRSRSPRRIEFNVAFPEGETFVAPLNSHLFQWVIENLCKNAIDAMEGSGTVSIVASQDARKIYIDVSDTGRGMSPSVQRKVFESGFTTKTRGWGLGLPLARRIVNQYHRGRLFLKYSVPGQGSCFRIVLKK